MSGKFDKVDKAFDFFANKRSNKETFTLDELKDYTEWGLSTVRTYATKRWDSFLRKDSSTYSVLSGFDSFCLDTFRQHHSQKEKVNKFFYQLLVDKSVTACIAAIEVYNKPDFIFREESFSILMVNAWELLLKAKILKENNDHKTSIQMLKSGKPILTAAGNPRTISITKAIGILKSSGMLQNIVVDSILLLVEIRDESVHFVHDDLALGAKVQSIGMASLKNFMTLAMSWFGCDFQRFNFYLMPISFYHLPDIESFSIDAKARGNLINRPYRK